MAEASANPPKKRFARELTALVLAPLLILAVGWMPPWAFVAIVFVVAALALHEFLALGENKGYPVQKTASILLLLFLLAAFLSPRISVELGVFAVLLVVPAIYIFSRARLDDALPGSAVCVLSTLYIGMLSGALIRLRIDFEVGSKLIFFLLLVVWLGDAGAYYVGRKFGKTRLSPRVSPKKSVEGGLGGVVTSLIAATVIHFTFFPEFPLVHALIAAAILSVTGVIGDLAESLWKRSADVKDSGTLIPGHGGFLDRFDSVLFTAPLLYGYWFLLIHDFRL
jgi:phosphatidate cytidylyltransferase